MKMYKVVPCPGRLVINKGETVNNALKGFEDVVAQETLGGWELVTAMPVAAVTKIKRRRSVEEPYNILIFSREQD